MPQGPCAVIAGFPADLTTVVKRGLPSQGNYECRQKRKCGSDCMARYETCCNSVYTAWPNCRNLCKEKGDDSIIDVRCPQAIVDYNCHMGGVDLGDQYTIRYE